MLATATEQEALPAWVGLAYTVILGTVVGSGVWLMARHPAGVVAPFSMLVPVVGIATTWLVLAERNMTVAELAEKVGLTPVDVSVLKNRRAKAVRFSTLSNYARYSNASPAT